MAKTMDPVLLILSILGYRAIIWGSFGGPGRSEASLQGVTYKRTAGGGVEASSCQLRAPSSAVP